jgi:outer membrane protein
MLKILTGFILSLLILPTANSQKLYDLKVCVDIAIKNNATVKTAAIDALQAELTFKQLDLAKYPTANGFVSNGLNFGRSINPTTNTFENNTIFFNSWGVQTGVDVFNWFSKKIQRQAAKIDIDAAKISIAKASEDIALNVAVAYIQILLAKEQIKQIEIQIAQRQRQIDITQKKVNAGVLPEINVLEFKTNLATDSGQYFNAQAAINSALLRMQAVLNIPASEPFDVAGVNVKSIPVETLADLQPKLVFELALKNLTQQRLNEVRYQAQEKRIESLKKAFYPTISVNGNLGTNFATNKYKLPIFGFSNTFNATALKVNVGGTDYFVQQPNQVISGYRTVKAPAYFNQFTDNFRQSLSFSINVPIFNGGINKINIARAQLNLQNIALAKQQDNLKLEQDIYKAFNDASNAEKQYIAALNTTNLAEKTFALASKRYELGLINNFDLSITQNNLFASQLKQLYSQYDYVFKIKLLEFYKGQGIKLQ